MDVVAVVEVLAVMGTTAAVVGATAVAVGATAVAVGATAAGNRDGIQPRRIGSVVVGVVVGAVVGAAAGAKCGGSIPRRGAVLKMP